ncbi:MAG: BTAD domain-containing putative transcriptional regulator [Fimbriimonadaceae bacterium]
MPVRIALFGDLHTSVDGRSVALPGRNERKLMALLSLAPSRKWDRRDLAGCIWPDVDFDAGGNRLRTALVGVRKAFDLEELLLAEGPTLELNPRLVETDVQDAKKLERRLRFAPDADSESKIVDDFLSLVAPGLLPSWDEEWVVGWQRDWQLKRLEALHRAADLALQMDNVDKAIGLAQTIIAEHPFDGSAWSTFLRGMGKLGKGAEAYRSFAAARKEYGGVALDISPQLVDLAKSVRDGTIGPDLALPALTTGAEEALTRSFKRMLVNEPFLAMQIVSSDSFRLEIFRNPAPQIELLESLLANTSGDSPARVALQIIAMRSHSVLHDVDRVLELGLDLLDKPMEPLQRRLVVTVLSFCYFTIRDYERANHFIVEAHTLADAHGLPYHVSLTNADRALYLWHDGNFEAALDIFRQTFEETKDESLARVSYAPAYLCGCIGSIHAMTGKFEEAEDWLRRGLGLAQVGQYREQIAMIEPVLGYVLCSKGSSLEGAQMVVSGLTRGFRGGNVRALEASLDFAAAALHRYGYEAHALGLIEWATVSRRGHRHDRTFAEQSFIDGIPLSKSVKPSDTIRSAPSLRTLLERTFEALNPR